MNGAIKIRILQGDPIIHDVKNAQLPIQFRGLPVIADKACISGCNICAEICPTGAIKLDPVQIDLGLCVFCPLCEETCPGKIIHFTSDYHIAVSSKGNLIVKK